MLRHNNGRLSRLLARQDDNRSPIAETLPRREAALHHCLRPMSRGRICSCGARHGATIRNTEEQE
jgi:hypothetical protein